MPSIGSPDVNSGDFPHLLVYGPPGAGKRTRIMCVLRELYGSGVDRMRLENHTFLTPSNKKITISTVSSNYHLEVNPRIVIQELIKKLASTAQLDSGQQRAFKVVVLNDADHLTRDAQHALRRTMEKYINTCRLILCAESTSKPPEEDEEGLALVAQTQAPLGVMNLSGLKPPSDDLSKIAVTTLNGVAAPSVDQISSIIRSVAKREGAGSMPSQLADRIARASDRNLRRALLMAEVARWQRSPMQPDQPIQLADWQQFLTDTASNILSEQSPRKILEVRGQLYELLSHCIPPDVIMRGLVNNLLQSCDGNLKLRLVQLGAEHEHRLQLGQKPIFHLEAFVVSFMAVYKRFVEDALGGNDSGW